MFRLIFSYMRQHKWVYLLIAVTLILYDVTLLVPTQVIQRLVDYLSKEELTRQRLMSEVLLLGAVTIINYAMAYIWHLKMFQSSVQFKFEMQQRAFRKLVGMRTPFYEKFRSGDILTRFSTDVEGMMEMVGYGLMILLYAGGMIAFILPAMVVISWQLSLLAIVPMLVLMAAVYLISKRQDVLVDENREAVAALNAEVLEVVEGVRVTRAYSKKADQGQAFRKRTHHLAQQGNRIASLQYLYAPMTSILIGLSTMLVLLGGAQLMKGQGVTIGQVLAIQLYLVSLVEPLWMLSDLVLVYQTGKTSFKKLNELIEASDDMEPDGLETLDKMENLVMEDYSFAYPGSSRQSLSHIDWKIDAGQMVGIVGKTGAGKTTLVRQFLRQYPVGSGHFLVNGREIRGYQRKSLEEKIGYVPQEHILFSKSVGENIAMGKSGANQEEILEAVETAAFSQDLARMSQGLETPIGERGVSISGGQKQRVSIARAFLRDPELLILDDSLSAVDARTERRIIENIQKQRAGKTTLIVTHRLSAVQSADWVLVLDEGRIVEEGRPADLLAAKGWYYEQYQRQQHQEGE